MAVVRGFVVFLKYDITGFGGLRKALLRWSDVVSFIMLLEFNSLCIVFLSYSLKIIKNPFNSSNSLSIQLLS